MSEPVNRDIYAATRTRHFTEDELAQLLRDVDDHIDECSRQMLIHRSVDLLVNLRAAYERREMELDGLYEQLDREYDG